MLERHLRQPMARQERSSDRATSLAAATGFHVTVLALVVLGLAHRVMPPQGAPAESAMITLPGPAATPAPPAPPQVANIAFNSPIVSAPLIAIAPEAAPPIAATTPAPLQTQARAPASSIAASAPASTGTGSGAAQGTAGPAGTETLDISAYLERVSRHIEAHLGTRDAMGNMLPLTADVRLYLHWRRNGNVAEVRLAKTSSFQAADLAALRAVRRSEPLPPIPPEFRMEEIKGELPVLLRWTQRR